MTGRDPDFLCIGAQKAGTTWLHDRLGRHPGVWLPPAKELHYLEGRAWEPPHGVVRRILGRSVEDRRWRRQFRRTLRRRGPARWWLRYQFGHTSDEWYRSLFAPAGERITGDIQPGLSLLDADRVGEVARRFPGLKIILLARHPIERAWSHALMSRRAVGGTPADREAILRHAADRSVMRRSDYPAILRIWADAFGADRVFLGFTEDIGLHPDGFLAAVGGFLGLAGEQPVAESRVVNTARVDRMPGWFAAEAARLHHDTITAMAHGFGAHAAWWAASTAWIEAGHPDRVPHPLWGSAQHAVWHGGAVPPLQSGVLSGFPGWR